MSESQAQEIYTLGPASTVCKWYSIDFEFHPLVTVDTAFKRLMKIPSHNSVTKVVSELASLTFNMTIQPTGLNNYLTNVQLFLSHPAPL